jgi:type IV secretory pathway TrbL component
MREGLIFLVLGVIVFTVFIKDTKPASYVGLVGGMALFIGFSAVLAKFGYSRQTMKDLRAAAADRQGTGGQARAGGSGRPAGTGASSVSRTRPAPTRRTSTGPSQRPNRKRR